MDEIWTLFSASESLKVFQAPPLLGLLAVLLRGGAKCLPLCLNAPATPPHGLDDALRTEEPSSFIAVSMATDTVRCCDAFMVI